MNTKTIHILVASIYLLVMGFGILVGQNIKPEQKSDSQEQITWDYIILNSGETITIEEEPIIPSLTGDDNAESPVVNEENYKEIYHSGFTRDDPRQRMVWEAYDLGGLEFVSLIECENGLRNPKAVWDGGMSFWLCQLNIRRHGEPLEEEWNDRPYQLSVCYSKWKSGTKFYWPQRLIWGKRCGEVVKERFYFL